MSGDVVSGGVAKLNNISYRHHFAGDSASNSPFRSTLAEAA